MEKSMLKKPMQAIMSMLTGAFCHMVNCNLICVKIYKGKEDEDEKEGSAEFELMVGPNRVSSRPVDSVQR